jgi:hypothetical protein
MNYAPSLVQELQIVRIIFDIFIGLGGVLTDCNAKFI